MLRQNKKYSRWLINKEMRFRTWNLSISAAFWPWPSAHGADGPVSNHHGLLSAYFGWKFLLLNCCGMPKLKWSQQFPWLTEFHLCAAWHHESSKEAKRWTGILLPASTRSGGLVWFLLPSMEHLEFRWPHSRRLSTVMDTPRLYQLLNLHKQVLICSWEICFNPNKPAPMERKLEVQSHFDWWKDESLGVDESLSGRQPLKYSTETFRA